MNYEKKEILNFNQMGELKVPSISRKISIAGDSSKSFSDKCKKRNCR